MTTPRKIVLAGPPHAGKSVLRELLKRAIQRRNIKDGDYPYVISGTPDGEGAWYQSAVAHDATLAAQERAAYKRPFTDDFTKRVAGDVDGCREPLAFVDIGGKTSPENRKICAGATEIVILYREEPQLREWQKFAADLNLRILAEFQSCYDADADVIEDVADDVSPLKGVIHHLERGMLEGEWPSVEALATRILGADEQVLPEETREFAMEPTFRADIAGQVLRIGFGHPGLNDAIVRDLAKRIDELDAAHQLDNGGILGVNGPASMPAAFVLAHAVGHRYSAVAVWDPKIHKYVAVISHDPTVAVGDLLDESELVRY